MLSAKAGLRTHSCARRAIQLKSHGRQRGRPAFAASSEVMSKDSAAGGKPSNQLEALKSMSTVVADSGDMEKVKKYQPIDCTTNPSLVLKAVQMPEYEHYLQDAINEEKAAAQKDKYIDESRPFAGVADRLIVDIGCDMLKVVPGRVSTEVDAHLSYDTQATIDKAHRIVSLYKERGYDTSRIYIKIASTWEGVQACKALEAEGINCNCTLIFSFAQGVACAQAKASLISPFVGRILDWFKAKHGKDSYPAPEDPGVLSVKKVYNYYKKYGIKTIVMAASFRNVGEIQELAGIDNITISPDLLGELEGSTEELPIKLTKENAQTVCTDEEVPEFDEGRFYEMHNSDQMAVDKLKEGIEGFSKAQMDLEDMLAKIAKENDLGAPTDSE